MAELRVPRSTLEDPQRDDEPYMTITSLRLTAVQLDQPDFSGGCIKFILRLRSKLYQLEIAFDTWCVLQFAATCAAMILAQSVASLAIAVPSERECNLREGA